MNNYKKQFRLFDIYQCIIYGEKSKIFNMENYEVSRHNDTIILTVKFTNESQYYTADNKHELREVIKEINKNLNNCKKPGRRKNYVAQ